MAETDTSPARLRELAERLNPEPGVYQHRDGDMALITALLTALAAEKEARAPAPDGWIPWEGGRMPVAGAERVDVRFRSGEVHPAYPADAYWWDHDVGIDDIVAYRLSKEG